MITFWPVRLSRGLLKQRRKAWAERYGWTMGIYATMGLDLLNITTIIILMDDK